MEKPKVTVVVTVKDAADTIAMCVESLLDQTYPNYDVLIIDAFSTDGTWEVLQEFKGDRRLELHRLRGSPPEAYNWALAQSGAPLVAFTDADCRADSRWLEELVGGFGEGVVATGGLCANPSGVNRLQALIGQEVESRFRRFPEFVDKVPTMNLAVRAEAAQEAGGFDPSLPIAYDTDFCYRLGGLGRIRYVPGAVVYHHNRPTLGRFFRQQRNYARHLPRLYAKHRGKGAGGDNISTPLMVWQEAAFAAALFSVPLLAVSPLPLAASAGALALLYLANALRVSRNPLVVAQLLGVFLVRNAAWTAGFLQGLWDLVRGAD